METNSLMSVEHRPPASQPGSREFVEMGFRWRWRIVAVFLLTLGVAIFTAFSFHEYESEMKLLVRRERVDPIITPDQITAQPRSELSEEELNAEIELLRSDDVLRRVVLELKLQDRASEPLWYRLSREPVGSSEEVRTARAIEKLNNTLSVSRPRLSNVITVGYRSDNPKFSTEVLNAVSRAYLDKHLSVRRPPGQYEFFEKQAEEYRTKLAAAEERLARFPRSGGAVAGQAELENAVRRASELRAEQQQTETAMRETEMRIGTLTKELSATSPRMTTAVRTADNPQLEMELKGTLLTLELKRTELLQKFQPSYREVQQVEQQIEAARAAIAEAEAAPPRDETTDRDPTYEWLRSELAKARTELSALEAKAISLRRAVGQTEEEARTKNESNLRQGDLLREAKALEASYQLYLQKREEARISDALDRNRILNVTMAQLPTVPVLPMRSPWFVILGGLVAGGLLSLITAFVSERLDSSFRNPEEVQWYLEVPVLALLPAGETTSLATRGRGSLSNEQKL
jgi:uncharacterized protein involved in exopolysaccharide biosynthesis